MHDTSARTHTRARTHIVELPAHVWYTVAYSFNKALLSVCVCVCGRVLTCILMQGLWTLSGNSVVINQGLQESKLLLMKLFNSSPVCRTHTSCRRKRYFQCVVTFFPLLFPILYSTVKCTSFLLLSFVTLKQVTPCFSVEII